MTARRPSPALPARNRRGIEYMARNFKELQSKMDSASRADNAQRVREELKRMALEELRSAKRLTQSDMAEMLDVPQSSISDCVSRLALRNSSSAMRFSSSRTRCALS